MRGFSGRLRERAKYYAKGFAVPDGRRPAQRYSPVRLMCSQPSGRDVGQEFVRDLEPGLPPREDGLAELQRVPVDDDRGQQVEAGDPVVLPLPGSVPQFAALVEVDGALERMVRLALVQADQGAPAHVGVRRPLDHEQGAFDAADFRVPTPFVL